ncbi:MAG: TfoX/Sxy family protein [Caulobacteraceae bacterium]
MAVSKAFVAYVQELLAPLGPVRVKSMFGGAGVYADELMFALVFGDDLYLRVDAVTEATFREAGAAPFTYRMKDGREVQMSYWRVPDEALDGPEQAEPWARLALEAAMRHHAAKAKGRRR